MPRGIIPIDVELLRQVLDLPDGLEVVGVRDGNAYEPHIHVIVAGLDVPHVEKGEKLPCLILNYERVSPCMAQLDTYEWKEGG